MRTDILTDENDDLLFVGGDLVIGQSDQQHVRHIVLSNQGDFKESPLAGFGLERYLKTPVNDISKFKRLLSLQLKQDGYNNPSIDVSNGLEKLTINV